jgi:hypothetical protein
VVDLRISNSIQFSKSQPSSSTFPWEKVLINLSKVDIKKADSSCAL